MALFSGPQYRWLERFLRQATLQPTTRELLTYQLADALNDQALHDNSSFDREMFINLSKNPTAVTTLQ
jgi:hypothetical protein